MDTPAVDRLLASFHAKVPHQDLNALFKEVMQTPSPVTTLLTAVISHDPKAAKKAIIDEHVNLTKYGEITEIQ